MAILNTGLAKSAAVDTYTIDNSLRINDDDAAYLEKAYPASGNRLTWTFSCWSKVTEIGVGPQPLFSGVGEAGGRAGWFEWTSTNQLQFTEFDWSSYQATVKTSAIYRDPASWYHVMVVYDSPQDVASDRVKLYVNGEHITQLASTTYPAEDYAGSIGYGNGVRKTTLGRNDATGDNADCYIAEAYYIDGTALAADSFGELDSTTNQWKPLDSDDVKDAVTFGQNGFYQKYSSTELAASFADSTGPWTATSFTTVESTTWTAPAGVTEVEYLVVAGGGAGGRHSGGGGGAGGFRTGTLSVTPGSDYTVTVGAGGASNTSGAAAAANDGDDSIFSSITSTGGGAGAVSGAGGRDGGSGGGDAGWAAAGDGNTPSTTPSQGNDGGGNAAASTGSGGGGATSAGTHGGSSPGGSGGPGGAGGAGTASSITGTAVTYSGGGGGGTDSSSAVGAGGAGGGGNGGNTSGGPGSAGTNGLGGGGGGSATASDDSGAGGSGIVVIRYFDASGTITNGTHTVTATNAVNQRPQHHDVTANGDAHLIGPKQGTSVISFDGSDYLTSPDSDAWAFGTDNFTVEMWVNFNTINTYNFLIGQFYNAGGSYKSWMIRYNSDGTLLFRYTTDGSTEIDLTSSASNITAGKWHHIAITRQSTNIRYYVDGVQLDTDGISTNSIASPSSTVLLYIGYYAPTGHYFDGYMGGLRISNSNRYPDGTTFTPPTSSFVNDSDTELLLQDGTDGSQTFTDGSSNGHSISTESTDVRWFAPKVGAGAMVFNGSDADLSLSSSVGNSLIGGSGDWTIEGWVKWISGSSIFMEQGDNNERALQFWVQPDGDIQIYLSNTDGSWDFNNVSGSTLTAHTWTHVALVKNGSAITLYKDGARDSVIDGSTTQTTINNSSDTFFIGAFDGASSFWNGYMDQVRFSRSVRYTGASFTVPTTELTDDINTTLLLNADLTQGTWFEDQSTGLAISTDSRMKFDGTGDQLTVPSSSDWNPYGISFTAEFWLNVDSFAHSYDWLLGNTGVDNTGWNIQLQSSGTRLNFLVGNGSSWDINTVDNSSGWAISTSTWYHVAVVKSGTTWTMYVDGVPRATGTSAASDYDNTLQIGASTLWHDAGSGGPRDFDGYLDEVRISDSARYGSVDASFTPSTSLSVDYLIAAGGGATDAHAAGHYYGGGGAGGYKTGTGHSVTAQAYAVVVGKGGLYQDSSTGGDGNDSSVFSVTATGGGGGGSESSYGSTTGGTGGSGGGGRGGIGGSGSGYAGGAGTGSEGNSGGSGGNYDGGGGGGGGSAGSGTAGAAGASSGDGLGGTGGAGTASSITGVSTYYCAGGAGARGYTDSGGSGTHGANGTGWSAYGYGHGGSPSGGAISLDGVVIIRYESATPQATGGVITSYEDGGTTYQVHTFTYDFTPQTRGNPFEADANTKLLIHSDYTGGLGADSSGNYNNFAATNLDAYDQMIDTPTDSFSVVNPLDNYYAASTFSEGNLKVVTSAGNYTYNTSTFAQSSGKWYCEILDQSSGTNARLGVAGTISTGTGNEFGDGSYHWAYISGTGEYENGGTHSSGYGSTYTSGDIIGIALDLENNKLYFSKNNTWQNSGDPTSGATGTGAISITDPTGVTDGVYYIGLGDSSGSDSDTFVANFGADSSFAGEKTAQGNGGDGEDFYYTPPTDYKALNTDNLSTPEIKLPGEHFNTVIWSGSGGARDYTGVGFKPDFLWGKARDDTWEHLLIDSVRGSNETLYSNSSNEESTDDSHGYVDSLDADGWSVVEGSSSANQWNDSGDTFVAWNWKAGGAPTADNDNTTGAMDANSVSLNGSLQAAYTPSGSPTVYPKRMSINTTSGFSIIEYDGNTTSGATVPHGLGVAPDMVILKQRGATGTQWYVGSNRTDGWDAPVILNLTGAGYDDVNYFHDTAASPSVITLGSYTDVNGTGMMAYSFASIEGYSKVGTWVATGSDPGPFFYCGFKPAFVMVKNVSSGSSNWWIMDNKRSTYNMDAKVLFPNSGQIEASGRSECDFLSNGVKFRGVVNPESNYSTNTYLIYAVAENPFKYSNAR